MQPFNLSTGETIMRNPPSFFVWTVSVLVFLSLAFAACRSSTVLSITTFRAPAPSPARDPVNQVYALAWAPDGTHLALGTRTGDIQLWNARSKILLLTTEQRFGEVYALSWSPDGTYLASGGQDQTVHVWNTTTGQQVGAYRSHFSTGEVLALTWSPNGKYLASGSNDGIGQVWDTTTHTLLAAFSNFSGENAVTALSWSPDGKLLASASTDGTVHIWDTL